MMKSRQAKFVAATLALAALSSWPLAALAAAGRVDFAAGQVFVRVGTGAERALVKGAEINTGETIRTGADGRVQLRMVDESYMSIVPNTQLTIDNFKFEGRTDGTEVAQYSILRGALRTVSGLIGRVNREKYRITTPTATVGIRGTGGEIQVTDAETRIRGTAGVWTLTNQFGSLDVGAGQSASAGRVSAPQRTAQGPQISAAEKTDKTVSTDANNETAGDRRTSTQAVQGVDLSKVEQSGAAAGNFNVGVVGVDFLSGFTTMTAPTDPSGTSGVAINNPLNPTLFTRTVTSGSGAVFTQTVALSSGTSIAEPGTFNQEIYWGRFTNGSLIASSTLSGVLQSQTTRTLSANQGVHSVYGVPTAVANMPTSGSALYVVAGATKPTTFDGSFAPGTFSGSSMQVNFAQRTASTGFSTTFGSVSYTAQGNLTVNGNGLTGSLGVTSPSGSIQGGQPCSATTCAAKVEGGFTGTAASSLGFVYSIRRTNTTPTNSIEGAAVYRKQ